MTAIKHVVARLTSIDWTVRLQAAIPTVGSLKDSSHAAGRRLPLTKASLDPETWQVHLEARGIVIDGKLDNIGSAHRVLSGTWTQAGQKGDFRLVRN